MGSKKIIVCHYLMYRFEERTIDASKELVDKFVQIFYEDQFGKVDITEIVANVIGRKVCKNKRYPNTIHTRDFRSRSLTEFILADVKRRQHEVAQEVQKYFLRNGI